MAISTSIVIPAYNGAPYLGETIASVLALSCDDWELLVIDDGSTDTTPDIAQNWAQQDPRIQYFRRDAPSGSACPARNDGYLRSHSESKYLLFLDQDDLLRSDALSRLRRVLELNPRAPAVHSLVEYIAADGKHQGIQKPEDRYELCGKRIVKLVLEEPTTFFTLATRCCISAPGSVLIRRSALEGGLPFPEDTLALDWDGWLGLTRQRPMVFLPEVTLSYRRSPGGMSRDQERMRQRTLATRQRVAANPLFTQEQREYILRASGLNEQAMAREKRKHLLKALGRGRLRQALLQGKTGLHHWERSKKYSRDSQRWIAELSKETDEGLKPSRS